MGTIWETLAIYGLQELLWFIALWRMGAKASVAVLGVNLALSWIIGEAFEGNDRTIAMILIDFATVMIMQEMRVTAHERLISALAVLMIAVRLIFKPYMDHHTYAAALNCAVVLQLLIAGGCIDQWGRSLDRWLHRLDPRLARAVRHVAT